jgi:hypothetical protein
MESIVTNPSPLSYTLRHPRISYLNLINDLIDISSIEASETISQIAETSINELLSMSLGFFQTCDPKKD